MYQINQHHNSEMTVESTNPIFISNVHDQFHEESLSLGTMEEACLSLTVNTSGSLTNVFLSESNAAALCQDREITLEMQHTK